MKNNFNFALNCLGGSGQVLTKILIVCISMLSVNLSCVGDCNNQLQSDGGRLISDSGISDTLVGDILHTDDAKVILRNWTTDGLINDSIVAGNYLFIGGYFTRMCESIGTGILLNKRNIDDDDRSLYLDYDEIPIINGPVRTIVQDPFGGFIVAGYFTKVGLYDIAYIARFNEQGQLDLQFRLEPNHHVYSLEIVDDILLVGGNFTEIGGQARSGIAAVNLSSYAVTDWNPSVAGYNSMVSSIAAAENDVYFAGRFSQVNGEERNNIASVNLVTGVLRDWSPTVLADTVFDIEVTSDKIYIAGQFDEVNQLERQHIAAFYTNSGNLTEWAPLVDGYVRAIEVVNGTIYIGGEFETVEAFDRSHLAEFEEETGTLTSWNPMVRGVVSSLVLSGDELYIGGNEISTAGNGRTSIAVLNLNTKEVSSLHNNLIIGVRSLGVSESTIFAGGVGSCFRSVDRANLAKVDYTSSELVDWNPGTNGAVYKMLLFDEKLLVAGDFTNVGNEERTAVAEIDPETGEMGLWNPSINGSCHAMDYHSDKLFVGGLFETVNGEERRNLASFNMTTGTLTPWRPATSGSVTGRVTKIVAEQDVIYISGLFQYIAGEIRNGMAAIDHSGAVVETFDVGLSGLWVHDFSIERDKIYIGGHFVYTFGQTQALNLAVCDKNTGSISQLVPFPDGDVWAVDIVDGVLYVGGDYSELGGEIRSGLSSINIDNNVTTSWEPEVDGVITHINVTPSGVLVSGWFTKAGGASRYMSAIIDRVSGAAL